MKQPKRNLAQEYLSEIINYGGSLMSRGEVISLMRSEGHPERCTQMYMAGIRSISLASTKEMPSALRESLVIGK